MKLLLNAALKEVADPLSKRVRDLFIEVFDLVVVRHAGDVVVWEDSSGGEEGGVLVLLFEQSVVTCIHQNLSELVQFLAQIHRKQQAVEAVVV